MNKYASNPILPAQIDWKADEQGYLVPISKQFGDVYFSLANGLAESRYVFIEQNQLSTRWQSLHAGETFTIMELGFGTGLNFLATWQAWQDFLHSHEFLPHQTPHLHFISTEKYPLTLEDLTTALSVWQATQPELAELTTQLLNNYPPLIAGCHRLSFVNHAITLDLWFGDAQDSLHKLYEQLQDHDLPKKPAIDAWYLDGFAPSCNDELWAETIFYHLNALSKAGTTVATFSCAGVVKRGLSYHGFQIKKVKGFGRKREMLTAIKPSMVSTPSEQSPKQIPSEQGYSTEQKPIEAVTNNKNKQPHIVIIGSGISGLMCAWVLANRGYHITLLDKTAPLAGASGNPRGLLAPKLTSLSHVANHLHTIGYLYSCRLFHQMNQNADIDVFEETTALDLMTQTHMTCEKIVQYPKQIAEVLSLEDAQQRTGLPNDLTINHFLPKAGLVNPKSLADFILTHPLIDFRVAHVTSLTTNKDHVIIHHKTQSNQPYSPITAEHAIICAAFESQQLDERIFNFRKIRGQLSWFHPTSTQLAHLPKIPLKYGGYCATFTPKKNDNQLNDFHQQTQVQLILGASFVRNDTSTDIKNQEHQHNRDKLLESLPHLDAFIPNDTSNWQARVGIRAQTPDYHPLVGQLKSPQNNQSAEPMTTQRIWTLSGMGSKGYALAPICAEIIADLLTGRFLPISKQLKKQIDPHRPRLQRPLEDV